ncbi:MAG: ATP-dependent zinc metalloprotease FtsH [Erysipelotrichales bacterium]|nr:ATP-dependent zinc metalloprotease FtsH [Erysipelotrichales bacterium]
MKSNKGLSGMIRIIAPYLIILFAVSTIFFMNGSSTTEVLGYNEFMEVLADESIAMSNVTVSPDSTVVVVSGMYTEGEEKVAFQVSIPNTDEIMNHVMERLETRKIEYVNTINPHQENPFLSVIVGVVPYIMLGVLAFVFITKMNGGSNNKAFEFGKSRARLEGDIRVRFDDVAGCDEEKEEMAELIEYLRAPKKFSKMGARIPKGILMVGPPGTGKTLLAKAVAGEADVPFYSISGSDFVEMFVGVGASRVRDMFKRAQQTAPCMVFIDEIDAVGRQRGAGLGGGHDEREQTLNQMLVEMDGMGDNSGIVVIAATNRPDVLDPALLRPGRFDRQITVNLPDRKGREAILKVHARNKKLADDISLDSIAQRTPGFSGADLENVLNEAAILAVRGNKDIIEMEDVDEAIDRCMGGPAKKSKKYTDEEKRLVAYHETGHAVIGLKLEAAKIVQKVTIIPRGQAGGYTLMTPKNDRFLLTKSDLLAQITGYLGGRVAEEIEFNEISTGASNDIQEATKIARAMVMSYGMSELGTIQYDHGNGSVFLGRDYTSGSQNYGNETAGEIDNAIRRIIDECYAEAKRILTENKDLVDLIANVLIEKETLTAEEIESLDKTGKLPEVKPVEKAEDTTAEPVKEAPTETTEAVEPVEEVVIEEAKAEEVTSEVTESTETTAEETKSEE